MFQPRSNSNTKNKHVVGKPGLQLKTVRRRGLIGGKVTEETLVAKYKRRCHNKKMMDKKNISQNKSIGYSWLFVLIQIYPIKNYYRTILKKMYL